MRVFKSTSFYPDYLSNFANSEVFDEELTYDEASSRFFAHMACWSNFWGTYLAKLEAVEAVFEATWNADWLQALWARENLSSASLTKVGGSLEEILLLQLKAFKPTVFFAHSVPGQRPMFLRRVREEVPSIKLIIGWDGAFQNSLEWFSEDNALMTCVDQISEWYRARGKPCQVLFFGFEPRIADTVRDIEAESKIGFIGSVFPDGLMHYSRARLLRRMATVLPCDFRLNLHKSNIETRRSLVKFIDRFRIRRYDRLCDELMKFRCGGVFGLDYYRAMRESLVALNCHGDLVKLNVGNMRLFEAAGVGACQLTDWRPNLEKLFEIDREIVTYKNHSECARKATELLNDVNAAREIGLAAQKRILRDYTFEKMVGSAYNWWMKLIKGFTDSGRP